MPADNASLPFPLRKGNPGIGVEGKVAFTNGGRQWTETINVISLAARALEKRGHTVVRHENWLEHRDSGLAILPQIAGLQILERGGVHSVTTVQVHHARVILDGVFEYQHSTGDTVEAAMQKGFDDWTQVDLVALLDAMSAKPKSCTAMELSFPAKDGKPEYWRRAILSPVAQFMVNPPPPGRAEEHPFCPCCFLTRTFEAFKGLVENDGFFALRFFGARGPDGTPQADCRVNGEDWGPGFDAIRAYVQTWPGTGYEFRKQYVLLQNIDGRQSAKG